MLKDFTKIYPKIDPELFLDFTEKEIMDEFFYFLENNQKNYTLSCKHNKIIKFFQQDNFYKKEKELWIDDKIKEKIINNRIKYLNKKPEELTTYDILSGFKLSGTHYGYSGFNPFLIKKFLKDNNCRICYDPCGGWGHRMLGATEIELYIYNDLSTNVYNSVNRIKDFLGLFNVKTYNKDARYFTPEEEFDAMFTCPPYFNLESYECGNFKNYDDYNDFLDSLFEIFYKKETCKIFGIVIRDDLIRKHKNYDISIPLARKLSKHFHKNTENKIYDEYLYIYRK